MDTEHSIAEQLVELLKPRRRGDGRQVVEDDEYFRMLYRLVRAAEYRTIERPENLPQLVELSKRLAEAANVAIATNAARYANDPRSGASIGECARAMGISQPAASGRRGRGDVVIAERVTAAGAVRFSEAARERDTISTAAAQGVVSMAEYKSRHAA